MLAHCKYFQCCVPFYTAAPSLLLQVQWSNCKHEIQWFTTPSTLLHCTEQGRHGEFEPGKAQYSTPIFFDQLFFIRVYWNSKSRQGLGLGALPAVAALAHMYWEQWLAANLGPKHFKIVCLKHSCGIPSLCQVLNWSPICRKNLKLFSLLDLFIVFFV